jgi:uncharacterized surface protein with fasciclin (FAS1) repeats
MRKCTQRQLVAAGIAWSLLSIAPEGTAAAPTGARACDNPSARVGVYVAPMKGDERLSRSISAILSMQIWETLQKGDPLVQGSDFGCGLVERITPRAPALSQLLLTGEVDAVGDDAILQASLTRVAKNDQRVKRPEVWTLTVSGRTVSLDPIKDNYAFAPVQIPRAILSHYTAIRDVKFCNEPKLPCSLGLVGLSELTSLGQEGDFARARLSDWRQGWLYLPKIGERSEVVDFVAAVIRLQRGDYQGADQVLSNVGASEAGTAIRVDALLLQAVARELSGVSGREALQAAEKLNPFLRLTFQVKVMSDLRDLQSAADSSARDRLVQSAKATLDEGKKLFDPNDNWYKSAYQALEGGRDGTAEMTVMVGGAPMYPSKNIVENAVNSKDQTTLVAAVKAAGLVDTLEGAGPFTVFAPTNEAFAALPKGRVETLLTPENKDNLTAVITYMVVPGHLTTQDLIKKVDEMGGTAMLKTVQGENLEVRRHGTSLSITDTHGDVAIVTIPDILQSNGVIHVINNVLVP